MSKILITGAAGFIGHHVVKQLLATNHEILGLDSLNEYYDVDLKYGRLRDQGFNVEQLDFGQEISASKQLRFIRLDLANQQAIMELFLKEKFDYVINLAAQAGVRYSLEEPFAYVSSNLNGFMNILEACRRIQVKHLVFASSSSVYGMNTNIPFLESHVTDHPISLYAATKKSNELLAHSYAHLYGIPITGLRFFTVYGPWGRPDMAIFLFTKAILESKAIKVFNEGKMERDFTYVEDVARGVLASLEKRPNGNAAFDPQRPMSADSSAPLKVYNIGNSQPVNLLHFIEALEKAIGKTAKKEFLPLQAGDVVSTFADTSELNRAVGYKPSTKLEDGVKAFVDWYRGYYNE
jgi:UDP-glucuronate 4-epimerase